MPPGGADDPVTAAGRQPPQARRVLRHRTIALLAAGCYFTEMLDGKRETYRSACAAALYLGAEAMARPPFFPFLLSPAGGAA
jgi:hypothetical protein